MSREERIARNQLRFREANRELSGRFAELDADEHATLFICECADARCTKLVRMSVGEYEATHDDPARFTIVPGHEVGAAERVVTENTRFAVVEKVGAAAGFVDRANDSGG
jgi:hypothetical protein